jgi:di/tricarboxylate transporter
MEVQNLDGLHLRAEHQWGESLVDGEEKKKSKFAAGPEVLRIAESVISPRSRMVGMSVRDLDFRRRYGVLVVGIHRRGSGVMKEDFSAVALEAGDTLLLQGDELALQRLEVDDDFLLLTRVAHLGLRRSRRWVALGFAVAVVVLATFGVLPIAALALMAAVLCVVTGCVEPREAYEAVDWRIIMMIFGMLSLGLALEKTGGADLAAEAMVHWFGGYGPWVMLSVLLLLVSVSTELLSNNAVAVLMTPIAIHVAEVMGVDVRPFLMAVVLGGSASFATPIGYQTNTIVYGAGGYRFSDFMRVGVPLNILVWLIGSLAIPFLWRF